MYKVVFSNTGDEIKFSPLNCELLEYYVSELNNFDQNKFYSYNNNIEKHLQNLKISVLENNIIINKLINFRFSTQDNYLDQNVLNQMHEDWVKIQSQCFNIKQNQHHKFEQTKELAVYLLEFFNDDNLNPVIADILHKLNLWESFLTVNDNIHNVEQSFAKIQYRTNKWIEIKNNFDQTVITNNRTQIYFPFAHLGRNLYNKFLYFDNDLKFNDENNFNELLGIIEISLLPTEINSYSSEYQSWCKKHQRQPTGQRICIGEILDLDKKLLNYRTILHRNNTQNNSFHIQLN